VVESEKYQNLNAMSRAMLRSGSWLEQIVGQEILLARRALGPSSNPK